MKNACLVVCQEFKSNLALNFLPMDPRSREQMEDEVFEAAERGYENGESPMVWRWQIDGLFSSDNPSKLHLRPGTERFDPRFKPESPSRSTYLQRHPAPILPLPQTLGNIANQQARNSQQLELAPEEMRG